MKNQLFPAVIFGLTILAGCGGADMALEEQASTTKTGGYIHKIQPLGVSTSCFGSGARHIRDHRPTPPISYYQYFLQMKDCSPPASSLEIKMLGGQQWTGGWSYVTIQKNGLCLTNPTTSATGGDRGETYWQACIPQLSSTPERYRQQWLLSFNHINAMRIETHAAVKLGLPGGQVQCLDRQTPTEVKRVPCTLNNWQIVRAN